MIIYLFDLVGTFAFAFVGTQTALRHRFNVLGIVVLAALTAVGGGTIREVILRDIPFYFYDYTYLIVILAACLGGFITHKYFVRAKYIISPLDALGTVTFAFNGALAAASAGLGLPAMITFAILTAFGGGLLCDIVVRQTPRIFRNSICIIPSLGIGVFCWILNDISNSVSLAGGIILAAYVLQLLILYRPLLVHFWHRRSKVTAKQQKTTVPVSDNPAA